MVGRQWLNMNAATEPLPVPALPDGVSLTEPFLRLIGTWLSLGQSSSLPAFRFDSQSINRWVMKQFGGKEKHIPHGYMDCPKTCESPYWKVTSNEWIQSVTLNHAQECNSLLE